VFFDPLELYITWMVYSLCDWPVAM